MTEPGFDDRERERIVELNRALAVAYGRDGNPEFRAGALRLYLETMAAVGRRHPMFAIANHRLFSDGDRLIVPYEARGRLSVFEIRGGESTLLAEHSVPHGTLLTDALLAETAGVQGLAIDLESAIYRLDVDRMPSIQVSRLRDLAGVLQKLNTCGSRHEAVYLLRFLVARFCSTNYRGIAGAKNLMPEVNRVRGELAEFMNGPFAGRLRLPTRVVVRNVSGLLSRPKLIDEVWQDTIVLAEVRVRGSAIANEIRRSTHHALGKRTLELARSYLQWLRTGEADFPESQRQTLSPADEAAREDPMAHELVARIVDDLEQLLGSSQVAARLGEWRQSYAADLLCCESGHSLEEELQSLIENGIRGDNRWVYLHRLRAMSGKASAGSWAAGAKEDFERRIGDLGKILPGDAAFQPGTAEALARSAVSDFSGQLRRDHDRILAEVVHHRAVGDECARRVGGSHDRVAAGHRLIGDLLENLADLHVLPHAERLGEGPEVGGVALVELDLDLDLARRGVAGSPAEGLTEHFQGPTAIAISREDENSAAKVLAEFAQVVPVVETGVVAVVERD